MCVKAIIKRADGSEERKTFRSIIEYAAWIEANRETIVEANARRVEQEQVRQGRDG